MDYAEYQAAKAGLSDQAGDILNTVMEMLLKKDPAELDNLLSKTKKSYSKKNENYTELDYLVLHMIKLNAHSPTSPYRHKTRNVPTDANVDPLTIEREEDPTEEANTEIVILEKCRKAREVLEDLNIPTIDKEIFSWKFFADNPLRSWPGGESYSTVCSTYNRVKRQMVRKIKNPHSTKRKWTPEEIRYLKAEFPHIETMKIAVFLNRNYNSVKNMANRLKLTKTNFTKRKINRKCGKKTFCKPVMKGDLP